MHLWAEIIGFLALGISILGYQIKNPKIVLWVMALPCALWAGHFFLLGHTSGMIVTATACARNIIGANIKKEHTKYVIPFCLIPCLIITLQTIQTATDVIPLIATCCTTSAVIMRSKPLLFRSLKMTGESLWILYAILIASLPLALASAFIVSSIGISIIRHDLKITDKFRTAAQQ